MTRAGLTRRELQEAAVRLFSERGYDGVTVEEIASSIGVSHMTFYRHFPTKVSVLIDDPYDPVIGEMVADTDATLPAIERICRGLMAAWSQVDEPDDEITRARFEILTRNEGLVAHVWANNRRTEQVIVEALVATGVPGLEARVAAGAVMGALMAGLVDWGQDTDAGPLGDRVRQVLEHLMAGSR